MLAELAGQNDLDLVTSADQGGRDSERRSASNGACYMMAGAGVLGVSLTLATARRQKVSNRRQLGQTRLSATTEETTTTTTTTVAVGNESEEDRKERFRALCTTLLREVGKAESNLQSMMDSDSGEDGQINMPQFGSLLQKLEVQCNDTDQKALFEMLDEDSSGTISLYEMKQNLRKSGVITELYREGIQNSLLALVPAVVLAIFFGVTQGASAGLDFVAGYVVEDSLSVDNLFVFLIIFKYFKVPPDLQKTCLDLGIYGAVVLRAVFIFLGLAAIQAFKPVLLIFAFILLYASYAALKEGEDDDDEEEEEEEPPEVIKNIVDALPTTDNFVGDKLFVTGDDGRWMATPLFLCILSIELSDILFAVDSVPAVFAVTEDPLIVFTSNIAAILGLRSLYQILSIAVQDLVYLEKAVAIILGFVGFKLVLEVVGFEISSAASLAVIVLTLGAGILLSLLADEEKELKKKKKNTIEKLLDVANKLFK